MLSLAAIRGLSTDEALGDAIAVLGDEEDAVSMGKKLFTEARDGTTDELVTR